MESSIAHGVPAPRRWPHWYTIVLCSFLGWVFMYADRTVLSPVLPLIGREWTLTNAQLGAIASVFFLAYAALQIPVGVMSDRIGRRLPLLVGGFVLFGLGTLASGLAPSYLALIAASVITGVGQSTYYPTQFALSSAVVPESRRALTAAVINSGQAFGISLGLLMASFVALRIGAGWRLPFLVLSLPTVLVGVLFAVLVREPAGRTSQRSNAGVRSGFSRTLMLLYLINFSSLFGFFVILTWLPFYLQTTRGYEGMAVGWISSLVPWLAVPGGLIASWISDRLRNRHTVALVMLPLAAAALFAIPTLQSQTGLMVALMVYGLTGKIALDPVLAAFVADQTEPANYSTVFGLFNFAGMLSSVVAPYVTGFIADRSGTLQSGFYMAGALLLLAVTVMVFLRKQPEAV